MKLKIFIIMNINILIILLGLVKSEIRFVFEMFRHGARAPWASLNNSNYDMYGEKWDGDSELTAIGQRQHFLLGHRNRVRYSGFLSSSYTPNEIYITSTDTNRTIMSAYSQLQGLFPPSTGPLLFQNQTVIAVPPINDTDFTPEQKKLGLLTLPNQMQVFPIHILNKKEHTFYLHDADVCPSVNDYVVPNQKRKTVLDFIAKFNSTYGAIFKKALKLPNYDFLNDYWSVYKIFDTFVAGYTDERELKLLRNEGLNLTQFYKVAFEFLMIDMFEVGFGDKDNYIGRMSMSPTMLNMLNWMQTRINNDIKGFDYAGFPSPKLVMYSGHDTNLGALQSYLKAVFNLKNFIYTPYASNIFFELYKNDNATSDHANLTENDYHVKVIYNDDEFLGEFITFKEFKNNIQKYSVSTEEINSFCKFSVERSDLEGSSQYQIYFITTIILALISLGLLGYVVFLCYKKNEVQLELNNVSSARFNTIL